MLDKSHLRGAMAKVGYEYIQRNICKAVWSSPEVEHFIYFSRHGARKEFLTAHYGVRNLTAETFGREAIRRYGGDFIFNALGRDEATWGAMRFSFANLTPDTRWVISMSMRSDQEMAASIADFVAERLIPAIDGITSIDALLHFLVEDSEPRPWSASNGAIRAAQIVVLAGLSGLDAAQTRALLEPHTRAVGRGFMKDSPFRDDPTNYLDRIQNDWVERNP